MRSMRGNRVEFRRNQAGMVSFLVVMIMMLVITLIVVGFTQVTQRNQREALDRQLGAQAYYAAESGINITEKKIEAVITTGSTALSAKTGCANDYDPADAHGIGSAISALDTGAASGNVSYTCVLVNPTPSSLGLGGSGTVLHMGDSHVFLVRTNTDLANLTLTWGAASSTPCTSGCNQTVSYLPQQSAWGYPVALLRVDVLQMPGSISPNALEQNTDTLYLTPYGASHDAKVYDANPTAVGTLQPFGAAAAYYGAGCEKGAAGTCSGQCVSVCMVKLPLGSAASYYYVRVTPLYSDASSVGITGTEVGGVAATFLDSQAIIDVTGRAQDQLQRIQARMNISETTGNIPPFALSSGNDICKTLSIIPGDPAPADSCAP